LVFATLADTPQSLAQDQPWTLLEDDIAALTARLDLIARAHTEISIACYNVDSGYVIGQLAQALSARTAQGLRARLLIDGLPARNMHEPLQALVRSGIEVKLFHPPGNARLSQLNRRLHSKLLVADDQALILGSRNLTDPHFGLAEPAFIDVDVLLDGPIATQGRAYFDWLWDSCGAESLPAALETSELPFAELTTIDARIDVHIDDHSDAHSESLSTARTNTATDSVTVTVTETETVSGSTTAADLALLFDRSTCKQRGDFEPRLLAAIDCAQHQVVLETPYPAFSIRVARALSRAARRGVCVTVLTNAANNTDRASTYAAWQNQKPRLQRAGVRVREYGGPGRIHSKTLVIDHDHAWIGSYNFDPRGERLNLELVLLVSDFEFVQAIANSVARRHAASATPPPRPQIRLTPGTDAAQRLRIRTLQLLMPLLRSNL
jgi:putative cardiolipin synthase